jgi:hypothetical protein
VWCTPVNFFWTIQHHIPEDSTLWKYGYLHIFF